MPRRREVPKRDILPDPKFGSVELAKFMNVVMLSGKKAVAERIVYGALTQVQTKTGKEPIEVFNLAINNIKPVVEVKSRRVGGANYQVPVEVRPVRRLALAMRWLREAAKKRGEKSMDLRLAGELLDASEGRGAAMKKREDTHKTAEANKAFSHFRWEFKDQPCLAKLRSSATATSVSLPISTQGKPPRPNVSCFIQVSIIRLAKCMMALLPWTGWNKSKNAELRLLLQRPLPSGKAWPTTTLSIVSM